MNNIVLEINGTEPNVCPLVQREVGGKLKSINYYHEQLTDAGRIAASIVHKSMEAEKNNGGKRRNASKGIAQNNRIHNIIPFIGERGVGKTSALLSFAEMLQYYGTDNEENEYLSSFAAKSETKNIRFTCLKCIDGSLLEPGEDIFTVILAQMYLEYDELVKKTKRKRIYEGEDESAYNSDDQKLRRDFEKLFQELHQLDKEEKEKEITQFGVLSPMESLKSIRNSLTLKSSFERLVKIYLKVRSFYEDEPYTRNRSLDIEPANFLVITVDDLDLNIKYGYYMLEKLHRYMMLPNIIILIAVDYEQLNRLCEKHFYEMSPLVDSKLNEQSDEIQRLSQDYLNKVLPYNTRIYMPNFSKSGARIYDEELNLTKPHGNSGNANEENNISQYPDLKQAIFKLIFRKTGMRLDTEGLKQHFFVPDTLRGYVSFYLMLKSMRDVFSENNSTIDIETFEHNYDELYSDAVIRMAKETLDDADEAIFNDVIDEQNPLPRSFRNLYTHIKDYGRRIDTIAPDTDERSGDRSKIVTDDMNSYYPKSRMKSLLDDLYKAEYSYGEILKIIYSWGRTDKAISNSSTSVKYKSNKPIVKMFLNYYSLEMMRSYVNYRFNTTEDTVNKEYSHLLHTLNGSFAGTWANSMTPTAKYEDDTSSSQMKSIGMKTRVNLDQVFTFNYDTYNGNNELQEMKKEDYAKLLRSFAVLAMFFDQPQYKNHVKFIWDFEKPTKPSDGSRKPNINCKKGNAVFNIFNFVSNSFNYKEVLVNQLLESLCEFLNNCLENDKKAELNTAKEEIINEYDEWYKIYGGFALPFYDMDLCYNIAKRVRQRMYSLNGVIDRDDYLTFLRELFSDIMIWLHKNDQYYGTTQTYNLSFKAAFENCPYIKWFLNRDTKQLSEQFDSMFINLLDNLFSIHNTENLVEIVDID